MTAAGIESGKNGICGQGLANTKPAIQNLVSNLDPWLHLGQYEGYVQLRHPLTTFEETGDPWPIGVAIILSAHCTDAAVNHAAPGFLRNFPAPDSVVGRARDDLIPWLPRISHRGIKSDYILNWARYLVERKGDIEPSIDALTRIKGIGRKTASLILYRVKEIDEGLPLDTHALRVLDRLAWLPQTKNPSVREKQLLKIVHEGQRHRLYRILTHHGRQVCHAQMPSCDSCKLRTVCNFARAQT